MTLWVGVTFILAFGLLQANTVALYLGLDYFFADCDPIRLTRLVKISRRLHRFFAFFCLSIFSAPGLALVQTMQPLILDR